MRLENIRWKKNLSTRRQTFTVVSERVCRKEQFNRHPDRFPLIHHLRHIIQRILEIRFCLAGLHHCGLAWRLTNGSVSSAVPPVSPKSAPAGLANPPAFEAELWCLWKTARAPMMSQKKKLTHTAVWKEEQRRVKDRRIFVHVNQIEGVRLPRLWADSCRTCLL